MYNKIINIAIIAQMAMAIIIMMFGAALCVRLVNNGQVICSMLFALLAYVCGYRLLLRASLDEWRKRKKEQC